MLTRFATMTALALLIAGPAAAQTATDPAAPAQTTPPAASPATPGTDMPSATTPATTPDAPATTIMDKPADAAAAPADPAKAAAKTATFIERQETNQVLASDMIGTSVQGSGDETIGEINDIILDREGNSVAAAVIGVGGFLGVGEKEVAVNFSDLQVTKDENGDEMLTLSRSREELEAAPDFKSLEDIQSEATAAAPAAAPAPAAPATTAQ